MFLMFYHNTSKFVFIISDFEEKVKLAKIFYNLKDNESARSAKLVQYGIMSCEEHERVYTRIFFDEVQALVVDEKLFFQNMHFTINPIVSYLYDKLLLINSDQAISVLLFELTCVTERKALAQ